MAYRIQVLTLQNSNLTFSVINYSVVDGDMISFTDIVSGEKKLFHASRVEIKEISDEDYNKYLDKINSSKGGWN